VSKQLSIKSIRETSLPHQVKMHNEIQLSLESRVQNESAFLHSYLFSLDDPFCFADTTLILPVKNKLTTNEI